MYYSVNEWNWKTAVARTLVDDRPVQLCGGVEVVSLGTDTPTPPAPPSTGGETTFIYLA